MESVEVSARSVDEAIDIALEELGLKRSQVSIEVLTAGKGGLFGLGPQRGDKYAGTQRQKQHLDSPRARGELVHNSNFRLSTPINSLLAMTSSV